jgi:predicted amidohydrolase YtcJ
MCDLILHNANVITLDPVCPRAELVAVTGNRISLVGGNELLPTLRRPETHIIDCAGGTLLPGFVDAHCHLRSYAENFVALSLSPREDIRAIADIQRCIRDYCVGRPPGAWVRGKGYNEFYIAEKRHPTRWDLDVAAPHHPVRLTHRSGHAHVLNSLALRIVGISEETGDPPEGLIDRDPATGTPTGILYGMGAFLAGKIPSLEDAAIERGLKQVNHNLLSYGITSIHDASAVNDLNRWKWFEKVKAGGMIKARVTMLMGKRGFEESPQKAFSSRIPAAELKVGGVKIIAGQVSGDLTPSQEDLNDLVSAVHEAGLQAVIHAVEEPVIEAACNAISYAAGRSPRPGHRHRIEHCSVCSPLLMRRIAGLGITVVTQPSFIHHHGDRYLATVPDDRLPYLYPIGSLMRNGLMVGASSDFPMADPNPLVSIGAAVTRMTEGGQILFPREGVTVYEALIMHTLGAAAAGFEEGIKGSISPGKLADLALLDENILAIRPERIRNSRVMLTLLDGKIAWVHSAFPTGHDSVFSL